MQVKNLSINRRRWRYGSRTVKPRQVEKFFFSHSLGIHDASRIPAAARQFEGHPEDIMHAPVLLQRLEGGGGVTSQPAATGTSPAASTAVQHCRENRASWLIRSWRNNRAALTAQVFWDTELGQMIWDFAEESAIPNSRKMLLADKILKK